jgi:hypothetical protein
MTSDIVNTTNLNAANHLLHISNLEHVAAITIGTFLAVISGLILYILKDCYCKHQNNKTIRKMFNNEISFNIQQMAKFRSALENWQTAISNNGNISLNDFITGRYNSDFTYSAAIFTQVVGAGIIFELVEHSKLEFLDKIYKTFQRYSTVGQSLNTIINQAVSNNTTISCQENRISDYMFINLTIEELDKNINFLKEIQCGI